MLPTVAGVLRSIFACMSVQFSLPVTQSDSPAVWPRGKSVASLTSSKLCISSYLAFWILSPSAPRIAHHGRDKLKRLS